MAGGSDFAPGHRQNLSAVTLSSEQSIDYSPGWSNPEYLMVGTGYYRLP
jgi:hypothetical protein